VNQAAAELLGEPQPDRMALTNTPGGDKILEGDSQCRLHAKERWPPKTKPRCCPCASASASAASATHNADARLRRPLLGAVTTLEDVTSLQDTDSFKTQFIAVASRKLRDPLLQLRRGLYALTMGFAGELRPLQAELVTAAGRSQRSWTT
jgi:NtrC-family two-component system sensor histidine kinase KinB